MCPPYQPTQPIQNGKSFWDKLTCSPQTLLFFLVAASELCSRWIKFYLGDVHPFNLSSPCFFVRLTLWPTVLLWIPILSWYRLQSRWALQLYCSSCRAFFPLHKDYSEQLIRATELLLLVIFRTWSCCKYSVPVLVLSISLFNGTRTHTNQLPCSPRSVYSWLFTHAACSIFFPAQFLQNSKWASQS